MTFFSLRAGRPRAAQWRLVAAWAMAAALAAGRSPDVGAEAGGTRWSTVDLAQAHQLAPGGLKPDSPQAGAKQAEIRAAYAGRAAEAGAELVWDNSGGMSVLEGRPVLYADPTLAFPASAPVRVLAVDMVKLSDSDPRMVAQKAESEAADKKHKEEIAAMTRAAQVLVDEYKKLPRHGDAAIAKRREIAVRQEEINARRAGWEKQAKTFREEQRKQLAADVVKAARERGATLVLDISAGATPGGVAPLVVVDAALGPAPGGGLRSGPAQVARVRTIDVARLYERHPRTVELNARLQAEDKKTQAEVAQRTRANDELQREAKALMDRGETAAAMKAIDTLVARRDEVKALEAAARDRGRKELTAFRTDLLAEIVKAAGDIARRGGATLVLDLASPGPLGVSYIAYAAPQLELTEDVARAMQMPPGR